MPQVQRTPTGFPQAGTLKRLLRIPLSGRSSNLRVLPKLPHKQREIIDHLESLESEPGLLAAALYQVNERALRAAVAGKNQVRLNRLLDGLRTSAVPGDWDGYQSFLDVLTESTQAAPSRFTFLLNDEVAPRVVRRVLAAKTSVHLSVFQLTPDKVGWQLARLLARRAQDGLDVRVMVDEFGTFKDTKRPNEAQRLLRYLRANGVEVVQHETPRTVNHLDHRKFMVIDGRIGFIGGMNVGLHYQRDWQDQQTEVEGPLVAQLQKIFLAKWVQRGGRPPEDESLLFPRLESEPEGVAARLVVHQGHGADRNFKAALIRAIHTAQSEINIAIPYVGDPEVIRELELAGHERGVKVNLDLPAENDVAVAQHVGRAYYNRLIRSGATVREVEGMFHLKVVEIDKRWVTFGSSNADPRSLEYNDEANVVAVDTALATDVHERVFDRFDGMSRVCSSGERWYSILFRRISRFI